jgi:hypothetical protein
MNKAQLFLILSFIGIIILLLLLALQKPILTGKISEIKSELDQTKIYIQNHPEVIIAKNTTKLNLNQNDTIKIYGKSSTFKSKTFIFADKIEKC